MDTLCKGYIDKSWQWFWAEKGGREEFLMDNQFYQ